MRSNTSVVSNFSSLRLLPRDQDASYRPRSTGNSEDGLVDGVITVVQIVAVNYYIATGDHCVLMSRSTPAAVTYRGHV